jgi:hypothetical protein
MVTATAEPNIRQLGEQETVPAGALVLLVAVMCPGCREVSRWMVSEEAETDVAYDDTCAALSERGWRYDAEADQWSCGACSLRMRLVGRVDEDAQI